MRKTLGRPYFTVYEKKNYTFFFGSEPHDPFVTDSIS